MARKFAVALHDLDDVWRNPVGSAVIGELFAADGRGKSHTPAPAPAVEVIDGVEAVALEGRAALVEAAVGGLMVAGWYGEGHALRNVRVWTRDGGGPWTRVRDVPPLPTVCERYAGDFYDRARGLDEFGGRADGTEDEDDDE